MLWELLIKDLKRARHNPWPYLINLALPVCITALIGFAFGSSSKEGGMSQIKIAIVDEDKSVLSGLLRGAMNQGEVAKYMSASYLERAEALKQVNADQLSAVLVIPRAFTDSCLAGKPAELELIKNPAQSFYPAIVEESAGVVVGLLNAILRNLREELPELKKVLATNGKPDMTVVMRLVAQLGSRVEPAEKYLFPPLVQFHRATHAGPEANRPVRNIFGYLLPGLASMFLLFLADHSVRDIYREIRVRTFDRFRTMHHRLLSFIVSKVILAVVVLLIGSAILFLGSGLIFSIRWKHPLAMVLIIGSFALCAAGFMAFIAALARTERRADVLNGVITMGISFMGGSLFPTGRLPAFMAQHISPLLPNYWFIEGIRNLQGSGGDLSWTSGATRLAVAGVVLIILASALFEKSLAKGIRG